MFSYLYLSENKNHVFDRYLGKICVCATATNTELQFQYQPQPFEASEVCTLSQWLLDLLPNQLATGKPFKV